MKEMTDSFAEQLQQLKDDKVTEVEQLRQQVKEKDAALTAAMAGQQFSPGGAGHVVSPVSSQQSPTTGFPLGFSGSAAASTPAPRISLPPLPLFSGEQEGEQQFSIWERDFAADMTAAGNACDDWPRYLRRCLVGAALSAYHEYLATEPSIQYADLVEKFRRRFDHVKTANEYQKDVDRLYWPRGEKIEDFGDRCLAACKKAKRSLDPRLQEVSVQWECHHVFLRCMPTAIRQMLRGCVRNQSDPDAPVEMHRLVQWVRRYLDDQDADVALEKERRVRTEVWQDRPRGPPHGGRAAAPSQPTFSPLAPPFSPSAPQFVPQQQQQQQQQRPAFENAPLVDWQQRQPQQQPQQTNSGGPLLATAVGRSPRVCFECGDPNHFRSKCPQRMNQQFHPQHQSSNQVQLIGSSPVGRKKKSRGRQPKIPPLLSAGLSDLCIQSPPLLTAVLPLLGNQRPPDTAVTTMRPACDRLTADLEAKVDATKELKEHLVQKLPSFCARTMMFLPMKVAGTEVDAQIDTGSPVVIINKDIVAMLSEYHGREVFNQMIQPAPKTFTDLQKNVIPLEGMVDVEFELNGAKIICPSMISLKMHAPLLIGLSFFEKVGLELSIPTGDSVVRWVLSPEREVNGEPVQIFFGRYKRKTLQEKGERRRQQKRKRRIGHIGDNLIEAARQSNPQLDTAVGAVNVQPQLIEAATASFVRFLACNSSQFGRTAAVEELGLSAECQYSVPDQLVSVNVNGFFWVEVRNDSRLDVSLEAGGLIVKLEEPLSVERLSNLEPTAVVSPCARCRRCSTVADADETVAVALDAPPVPNMHNLHYSSLEDRLQLIAERANIGGDNEGILVEQRAQMLQLLQKNHDVVALDDMELGESTYSHLAHQIDTGSHPPIAQPCRRLPFSIRAGVEKTLTTMQRSGVIRPLSSPWASLIVPVRKPDGSIRITVDYRRLNAITVLDKYPTACCEDLLDSIGTERPQFFSTLDLAAGYHQQLMHPNSIAKTAFQCPFGHFEYTRLPMGLTNAPANFQRLLDELLRGVDREKIKNYLDDVAIVTNTFDEHMRQLQIVFDRFRQAGLRVKLSKCRLLRREVLFLGFLIDHTGLRPNPVRVQGILEIKPPKSLKEIRQFVGCCSYYRRFVKGFAEIARPLTNLLRKDMPWEWGEQQQLAFEKLKAALISPPVLHYPRFGEPFYIVCDASSAGLGAILHQKDESGKYAPVAFASRATHRTEQNYSATDLEALCLTWSLQNFHHYILGHEIVVELDHAPLLALNSKAKLPPRLERWNTIISNYGAKIVYRKGKENEAADMLSRYQQVAGSADAPAIDESSIIGLITTGPPVADPDLFPTDMLNQRLLQLQDSFFGRLIRFLEDATSVPPTERQVLSKMAVWYRLSNGVLYFRRECDTFDRICIPEAEQMALVEGYHCGKNSGAHLSALKTYHKLALKFFWPSMKKDVFQFCRRCLICALEHGVERRRRPPLQPVSVQTEPFAKIGIDVIKFPLTSSGNDRALGIVDYFSGFLIFVAIPNETAATIADILVERVFNVFGAPQEIVSDQGVNFTSVLLKELETIFRIKHRFTTTFTPRSNGKVERANRTMKAILTRLTTDFVEDWDRLVSHATFAYNSTPQESTGLAPHYVVFGRIPQPVSESVFDRRALGNKLDLDDYVSQLERNLSSAYAAVQEELGKNQLRQQDNYNKTAAVSKIVVGDSVMLFRPDLKNTKLKPSFDGPYKVVWVKQNNAGICRLSGGQVEIHNLEKLSRCPPGLSGNQKNPRRLRTHFRNCKGAIEPNRGYMPYNLRSTKNAVVSAIMNRSWDEGQVEDGPEMLVTAERDVDGDEEIVLLDYDDYEEEADPSPPQESTHDSSTGELSPVFGSSLLIQSSAPSYGSSIAPSTGCSQEMSKLVAVSEANGCSGAPVVTSAMVYDPIILPPELDPRFPDGPPPICDPLVSPIRKKVAKVPKNDIGEPWSLGPPQLPLVRRKGLSSSDGPQGAPQLAGTDAPLGLVCQPDNSRQEVVEIKEAAGVKATERRPKLKSVVVKATETWEPKGRRLNLGPAMRKVQHNNRYTGGDFSETAIDKPPIVGVSPWAAGADPVSLSRQFGPVWENVPIPLVVAASKSVPLLESALPPQTASWRPDAAPPASRPSVLGECWRQCTEQSSSSVKPPGEGMVVVSSWRPRGKRAGKKEQKKNRHKSAHW